MRAVRERLVHAGRIKPPNRCPAHDVNAKRAEDCEVDGGVHLLHEAALLRSCHYAIGTSHWPDEALHQELPGEGEDDDIEGDELEIVDALAIVGGGIRVGTRPGRYQKRACGLRVGDEDGGVERVRLGGIDGIEHEHGEDNDERVDPCVCEGEVPPPAQQGPRFPPLRPPLLITRGYGLGMVSDTDAR